MNPLKLSFLILLLNSLNVMAKTIESPADIVDKFLSEMKVKNYYEAAEYVAKSELLWLKEATKPLLYKKSFYEDFELEPLGEKDIKEILENDAFEFWSQLTWETRGKNFGLYEPENILGFIKEKEDIAHVVVRDLIYEERDPVVYTLVLESKQWRVKLPRIFKGTVYIYNETYK
ncbi:hypothetical protein [Pseudoalteromonas denitrificans]|uniref:DUF3828 domain-containing protein n=1 Tax=Pseudoalteromonas denitrificans DSM 6059 TaxID=1123010 RepID=A0A1I1GJ84_9GAMM|nr:hypothetical protein [Pseudoalteromonas denitrificans]SFC11837.1 hypothetical protein SAMN02745724_00925 [Pseudoalteromonas denitrificans DSM 6059]